MGGPATGLGGPLGAARRFHPHTNLVAGRRGTSMRAKSRMHVALVWRLATVVAIVCSATARPCSAQVVDWSGQWSSRSGRDVEVLRNVHVTPAGWDGLA